MDNAASCTVLVPDVATSSQLLATRLHACPSKSRLSSRSAALNNQQHSRQFLTRIEREPDGRLKSCALRGRSLRGGGFGQSFVLGDHRDRRGHVPCPRSWLGKSAPSSLSDPPISVTRADTSETEERWDAFLKLAASLYPAYMILGGLLATARPESFAWFVRRSPNSYSCALGAIMLATGLTLRIQDLLKVVTRRPRAVAFGFAAQYCIMPATGVVTSRLLGLSPELSAGLILLSCCPGGTASNVVTMIANGDVPLSVIMTVVATLGAAVVTPILTQFLAGALVPVDAVGLALSTLQVVVAPVLLGTGLQHLFPHTVGSVAKYCPVAAVFISSLLACSVFSSSVPGLRNAASGLAGGQEGTLTQIGAVLAGVCIIHVAGFCLGYFVSKASNFEEPQRRAICIEVGMQNSSLGVLLASKHFASPMAALPATISAVVMNIMGSGLAAAWRHLDQARASEGESLAKPDGPDPTLPPTTEG